MLYAMIDVGSNTIRMAIYDIDGDRVEMLMKRKHTVGLASYVRDGVMQRQGIDKVVEIISEYRHFWDDFGITQVTAFTTAALRNSVNGITELIFDLDKLDYISSAGLRVLLSAQKVMNKQGEMTIINVKPEIMEIFDVTGFVDILNIE